ncbi:MAG: polyphosphate kinase [Saprospiraceae bacterium]|nr:polyphosphate kinase [Saprospiraceae bacterium]
MAKINLSKYPTVAPKNLSKEKIKKETKELVKKIGELEKIIYAERKHSVLIILQGMDASGKDGAARNVFANCNALSLDSYCFRKPTEEEFSHDFLWRVHKQTPAKGHTKIFIRSHYEDILIQAVHGWIDADRVRKRMDAINAFEELIQFDNNTTILKFYLHISPERQLEKLEERKVNPEKHWKYNPQDFEERKLWDKYMERYEYAFNNSTIPWHIIPCDQRWYRDYCIAKIVLERLKSLKPKFPPLKDE